MGPGLRAKHWLGRKETKCKKCVVCGTALHSHNKSGLCSGDSTLEFNKNLFHQRIGTWEE